MGIFYEKYGPWAIITGAGTGIGAEFAGQLAGHGLNLVLVDRMEDGVKSLAEKLSCEYGIEVKVIIKDLEQSDFLPEILQITDPIDIGLLVNNAGFAITGEFLEHDLEKELGLLYVNCRAPLMLAHAYGRKMVDRGRGGIIFLSSIAALLPMPYWLSYSASKVYDLYIANGLNFELKDKGVDVLAVCPGNTKTNFADTAGIKSIGMEPEYVVMQALKKIGKKPVIIPGMGNRIVSFLTRMMSRKGNIKIGAQVVRDLMKGE